MLEQNLNFKNKYCIMKRILYILTAVSFLVFGCDPMEDIYNDLDSQANPIVGTDEITLTSDDYAGLVEQGDEEDPDFYETYEAFMDLDDAKTILPGFLSDKYPLWGEGSSVTVNFNLYEGNPEDVSAYVNAEMYEMVSDDYPNPIANAFYPTEDPDETIPDVLDAVVMAPEEGQITMVQYKQFTEEPVEGIAPVVEYDFTSGGFDGWTPVEVSGSDEVWVAQPSGNLYVQGNGYFGGAVANEEWLVSPSIDLTGESNLVFQIEQEIDYLSVTDQIDIMISTDYTGDVTTATWTALSFDKTAFGNMTVSEDFDFSAYDGQQINIAFKYVSSDTDAGRWRIASASIKAPGIEGPTLTKVDYYKFDGSSWSKEDDVYYLTSADYDSMGEASGQPGQYNNFSGSTLPGNYLPIFLNNKFPYAQEEDQIFVMYRYYEGGGVTNTKGNLYTFMNGEWVEKISSLQFTFEDGEWVPDNTIRYTLTNSDYEYIASALADNPDFDGLLGTLTSYHDYDYNWTEDQIIYSLGVLADNIDPNAEVGQKYLFTYLVYDNGLNELSSHIIKNEDGSWSKIE